MATSLDNMTVKISELMQKYTDEVKKEAGSAEATETPKEDNAPEAEKTEEKSAKKKSSKKTAKKAEKKTEEKVEEKTEEAKAE